MKKLLFSVAAVTTLSMLAFTVADPLTIGSSMPKADVKMKSVKGNDISMKDAKLENGVLVMFSCNTCPYVIKNQERTLAICEYADKNKVGVIILNSNEAFRSGEDSYSAMQAYAKDQKYKWNYVVDKDHEIADAFGADRTPECFLFNKDLTLVYHGAIDDSPAEVSAVSRVHLKEAINEMVAGKNVTVKESRSVGCKIKRNK